MRALHGKEPNVQSQRGISNQGGKVYTAKFFERLDDNLFVIHASARVKKFAVISRNVVVIRHNKRELTLVNPVRLDPAGEGKLLELGTIQRIIRLAPCHGCSHDRYYLERFPNIRRWAPLLSAVHNRAKEQPKDDDDDLPVHRVLSIQDDAILPGCHIFCFRETLAQPECALLILQDYVGNLLVTAEVMQSHLRNPHVNAVVRARQTAEGLMQQSIVIPPSWLRNMSLKKSLLRIECERLLRLDFERLISSSGVMVYEEAKEKAVLAVEHAFPQW